MSAFGGIRLNKVAVVAVLFCRMAPARTDEMMGGTLFSALLPRCAKVEGEKVRCPRLRSVLNTAPPAE